MSDQEYADFLRGQEEIYRRFSTTTIEVSRGINPPTKGYLIALRHPSNVTQAFSNVSNTIARITPCICYGEQNAHTTLGSSTVGDLPASESDGIADKLRLCMLEIDDRWQNIRINYGRWKWLLNKEAVIAAGEANEPFVTLGQLVNRITRAHGLALQLPWGAHSTIARFTAKAGQDVVDEITHLLRQEAEPPESRPIAVEAAEFLCDASGFHFKMLACVS